MHGRRNSWVASYPGRMALGTRLTPGLPRKIFCDATTLPKQIETACTRGPRDAGSIESAELE